MTVRNEPSVGTVAQFASFFTGKQSVKDPALLVSEALQSFQAAQDQLEAAQAEIEAQISDQQAVIAAASVKVSEANDSLSKISRIKVRIEEFLS